MVANRYAVMAGTGGETLRVKEYVMHWHNNLHPRHTATPHGT